MQAGDINDPEQSEWRKLFAADLENGTMVKAVQVEHIRVDPGLKGTWLSTS